jgi:hypothetical protein
VDCFHPRIRGRIVRATFLWMVHVISGVHGRTVGKIGEEATAEALSHRWQRRQGWRVINGIYIAGHGDVDQVLVCPAGVFAIESKWTSNPCRIHGGGVAALTGREPVSQARDGARKVERLLRHGAQRFGITVQPVVVLWGPGALHLDQGWTTVDDVLVCEGRKEKSWLMQLSRTSLDQDAVAAITEVLEDQVGRQVDRPPSSTQC